MSDRILRKEFAIQWDNGDVDTGYDNPGDAEIDAIFCGIGNESWAIISVLRDSDGNIQPVPQ